MNVSLRSSRMTLGVLASAAIHLLLIGGIVSGSGMPAHSPRAHEGLGANAQGSPDEAITTLFFVEDSSATSAADDSLSELASAGQVLQSLRLTIISTDASIDAALRDSEADERLPSMDEQSAGEREARAALFGRYLNQIQARVERAWVRPRAPVGGEAFDCEVQVVQGSRGEVQEVTLKRCNGSAQWRLSLVHAIERASPLPAPPDEAVFSKSILMSFQALAYAPGSQPELYEPEPPASTAVALSRTTYLSEGH